MSMPGNVLARVGPHNVPAVDMAERWEVSTAANVACERVAAVVLSLLAAVTIMAELFVIRPFFTEYYQTALYAHNGLLASGVLVLAGGEFRHYWLSRQYVRRLAGSMKRRKQQKPAG